VDKVNLRDRPILGQYLIAWVGCNFFSKQTGPGGHRFLAGHKRWLRCFAEAVVAVVDMGECGLQEEE